MTTIVAARRAPISAPRLGIVLAGAALAWVVVLHQWGDMGAMPGTMGFSLPAFVSMWTVMMAAMMLPATAPIASMYARSLPAHRTPRMALFTAGYLGVWAAFGLVAFALALGAGRIAAATPAIGTTAAVVVFAVNGAYQLSGWKDRCLTSCRAPFSLMLRYASWQGRTRDLRAGAHHGAFCVGCCWSLMVLLAAFGVMNLWAMVGLTVVVAAEKVTPRGQLLARSFGGVSLAAAVAVVWVPGLAPGLTGGAMGGM